MSRPFEASALFLFDSKERPKRRALLSISVGTAGIICSSSRSFCLSCAELHCRIDSDDVSEGIKASGLRIRRDQRADGTDKAKYEQAESFWSDQFFKFPQMKRLHSEKY